MLTVDPSTLATESIALFRSVADVSLELSVNNVGRPRRRDIAVTRFAGKGRQVGDSIDCSVRPGVGIVVENRTVV